MQIHPSKKIGNTTLEKHVVRTRNDSLPYDNSDFQKALFLMKTKPKESLKLFLKIKDEIQHPQIHRYITFLYLKKKKLKKAKEMINKAYELFPNDPLSLIHFADSLLVNKKIDKWGEIIEHPYNLPKQLKVPSLSLAEMQAFLLLITQYHIAKKDPEESEGYLSLFSDLAPDHPLIQPLEKKVRSLNKRLRFPWRSWWKS